jgi:hypothetical protein
MNMQKIIIGLFAIFGLLPITWADSLSTVALQRDAITKYNVYQAVYILMGLATDADADGYFETPAILAGTGSAGGGLIPTNSGAPLSDGYGNLLGYCAWDNGATTNAAGHIAGSSLMVNKTMAIVAPGVDGIFDTSCASIFAGGGAVNDDYVLSMTAAQVALGVGGANDVGKAVGSLAALNALSTTSIPDGQIRLATDSNSLYRWNAGTSTWVVVSATPKWIVSGNDLAYSAGNVGIGGLPDPTARFHVQGGVARFDGGINVGTNALVDTNRNVTANSLTFVDGAGNRMVVNSGGYGIGSNVNDLSAYVAAGGTFSVRQGGYNGAQLMTVNGTTGNVNSLGGYSVGGVTFIDSARNIANVAALTASGAITGGSFASAGAGNFGALQIGGVGVVDAARNIANVGNITVGGAIAATGYVNSGSGFQVGGVTVIDSSRNIGNVGMVTATSFVGALIGNATTASNISNTGTVTLASPTESNSITITQPAYTTDKPVKLLNFNWYSDTWSLGNIRSGSSSSNGFGVFLNGAEQVRFTSGGGIAATTGNFSGNMSIGSDAVGGTFNQRAMNGWMDVLNVYRGGALKWSLQDSGGVAKFTSGLQIAGNLSVAGNGAAYFGPNSNWGATLRVGGNGGDIDAIASVATTNGNLHLDAATGSRTFLNHYKGTGGVGIYNGLGNGGLGVLDAAIVNATTFNGTLNGNASTATNATNSALLAGYAPNQSGGANTIVQRDVNGFIFNSYFNTSAGGAERNTSGMGYFAGFNPTDNYIRSYTNGAAAAIIQSAASGTWGINITGNAATATNATNAGNADTVDGQHFAWSNADNNPTYVWAANANGSGFLAARGAMSVNYANSAGSITGQGAFATMGGGNAWTQTGIVSFVGNQDTGSGANAALQVVSNNAGGAMMSFHRQGHYAVNMGLDSDNVFRIGGWSAGANRLQLDMSGNLTVAGGFYGNGAGLTGTAAGLNIGGNAATASSAASVTGPAHVNGSDGWFRSNGAAGWFNETYSVGIFASQAGRVDLYNGAALYVPGYITAGGDINGPSANFGGGAATFNSTAITFTKPVVIAQVASNGAGCSTPGGLARDGANDLYICK